MRTASLTCFALLAATTSFAAPVFKITEAYTGVSGPDGTADWIEVTNFGDMVGDTASLFYEDESLDIGNAGQLTSFMLAPGASAVFLVGLDPDEDASAIAEFKSIWGAGINVGVSQQPSGGGLGQGGDVAGLLLSDGTIVDTLSYNASGAPASFDDPTGMASGEPPLSVVGVNGAYESAAFVNDTLNPIDPFLISLAGSPGRIPEPAGLLLLAGGLAAATTRRRG